MSKNLGDVKKIVNNGINTTNIYQPQLVEKFEIPSISVSHPFFGNFRTCNEDLEENAKVLDNLLKIRTPEKPLELHTLCACDMYFHHF